jgi:hypothetical protein
VEDVVILRIGPTAMNIKAPSDGFWGGAYVLMLVLCSAACGADKSDRKLAAWRAGGATRQAAIA